MNPQIKIEQYTSSKKLLKIHKSICKYIGKAYNVHKINLAEKNNPHHIQEQIVEDLLYSAQTNQISALFIAQETKRKKNKEM